MAFACAHRGLSGELPENTLAAFGAAVAAGFPALELDLHATKDGHAVILHDTDLQRTHGHSAVVAELEWQALAALPVADPVPRLGDLFAMLRAWQGLYNLEVKSPASVAAAYRDVQTHGVADRAQFSSMNPAALLAARTVAPHIPRGFIPFGPIEDDDVEAAREAGCAWINVDHDFVDSAEEVRQLTDQGFRVGCWTVNDAQRAKVLGSLGVACVITDLREVGAALRTATAPSW